jgi:putative sugar O-methyltransferase
MVSYNFSKEFVDRFSGFVNSPEYQKTPDYAKTDYWEYHAGAINVHIDGNAISIDGKSGFYVAPPRSSVTILKNRAVRAVKSPAAIARFAAARIKPKAGKNVRLMDYFHAFDAVMSQKPVAEVDITPDRIDFRSLSRRDGIVASIDEMKRVYFAGDKYRLNAQMVYSYYLANILHGYMDRKPETILEIGAGNGNLASLLHYTYGSRVIIVDLPETLCLSIPHIASLFPEAKVLMPHESGSDSHGDYDFIFLTADQTDKIKDNSVDLAVCNAAFQEMTHRQIKEYFDLIQRTCLHGGYFLYGSRVEKIPAAFEGTDESDAPVNRFSEYPWNPNNRILVYEICRLLRLVQLDNSYVRLEQIVKNGQKK